MPAAILIPLAIQAGASVGSALIQHHAAGKAAKQQEAAGERARQDLAPYASAGARAASAMSDLTFGGPPQAPQPMQPPPGSMASTIRPGSLMGKHPGMFATQGQPPPGSMAAMMPPPQAPGGSGYQPQGQGVQMQAPDGRMVLVPHDQVQAALANGGKQVG